MSCFLLFLYSRNKSSWFVFINLSNHRNLESHGRRRYSFRDRISRTWVLFNGKIKVGGLGYGSVSEYYRSRGKGNQECIVTGKEEEE